MTADPIPFPYRSRAAFERALHDAEQLIDAAMNPRNRRIAKRIARSLLRRGAYDGEVRAKFGWLARHVSDAEIGLRGAILLMDRYAEMAAEGVTLVRVRGAEQPLDRYSIEAIRIVLRFVRTRVRWPTYWRSLLAALTEPVGRPQFRVVR